MPAAPSPLPLPGFERSLAVVMGINAYSHGVPPLHNAVRDASAMADTLERQGFEVMRLLDSQASLSALSELLHHKLPTLEPAPDRLLIYFAGHGLAHTDEHHQLSGFLLPADAHRDDSSSYWPMASLREALGRLPCRHLLLILDCCFAGAFPHSTSRDLRPPQVHAPLFLERFRHFSSRRSFQLLVSTSHDELASDRLLSKPSQEALGSGLHSPFACALLEALGTSSPADSNRDGLLTASELYTSLRDRLVSLLPSHSQQTPTLRHLDGHDGGEFLFLLSESFPSLPSAAPLSKRSNPYLGLRPFDSEHRHLFFGRERIVDTLVRRLESQPLVVLCGPSGAGKSSLVQAGLLPRLAEQGSWIAPPALHPSTQPLQQLSSWLQALVPETPAPCAAALSDNPDLAADFLHSFLSRNPHRTILLVVDSLEELVTTCLDEPLRVSFLRALSSLLCLSDPCIRVLLLLRADFEPHFLPLLSPSTLSLERWRASRFLLPPMNRDELRRCIQKPAEACVLFFASGLVERLLDDVEQMPGALPLLSMALSELFDAYLDSGREDRTLSFEDYQRLGDGISHVLQIRAEFIYAGAPYFAHAGLPSLAPIPHKELDVFRQTLRNVLLRMVSVGDSELTRRRVPRSELTYPQPEENARVQRALAALEQCRLVVARDDNGPCVEPAHDALLTAWPRLRDWARHAQRELILLHRVSRAASEWILSNRDVHVLWPDARLEQFKISSAPSRRSDASFTLPITSPSPGLEEPLALNLAESEFLRASAAHRRTLRIRRYSLMAAAVASILVVMSVIIGLVGEVRRSAVEASVLSREFAKLSSQSLSEIQARERTHQEENLRFEKVTEQLRLKCEVSRTLSQLEVVNEALTTALWRSRLAVRRADHAAKAARAVAQQEREAAERLRTLREEELSRLESLQTQINDPPASDPPSSDSALTAREARPWARGVSQEAQRAAEASFQEGNSLVQDGALEPSLEHFRRALELWDHPAIHYNLAIVLLNLKRIPEARVHLKEATRYGAAALDLDYLTHAFSLLKLLEGQK